MSRRPSDPIFHVVNHEGRAKCGRRRPLFWTCITRGGRFYPSWVGHHTEVHEDMICKTCLAIAKKDYINS